MSCTTVHVLGALTDEPLVTSATAAVGVATFIGMVIAGDANVNTGPLGAVQVMP